MLTLLQPDKTPATTGQLRGRIGDGNVLLNKQIDNNALSGADGSSSDAERAVPIPKVKVEQVAPFNDGLESSVQTGQPTGAQLAALPNTASGPAAYHTVARGDTLYNVSRRYGTDVGALAKRNNLPSPYTISLGQRLELPPGVGVPDTVAVAAVPSPPAAQPVPAEQAIVGQPALQSVQPPPPPPPPRAAAPTRLAVAGGPRTKPSIPARRVELAVVSIGVPPPRAGGAFAWPVDGPILVAYGPTSDGLHNDGLNIAAPMETPVRAAENGVVAYAGNEIRGFGKLLLIKHDGGLITAYGHNSNLLVRRGDVVRKGQVIARVGASGGVGVPQLHFEIRDGRRAVDPNKLLPARSA